MAASFSHTRRRVEAVLAIEPLASLGSARCRIFSALSSTLQATNRERVGQSSTWRDVFLERFPVDCPLSACNVRDRDLGSCFFRRPGNRLPLPLQKQTRRAIRAGGSKTDSAATAPSLRVQRLRYLTRVHGVPNVPTASLAWWSNTILRMQQADEAQIQPYSPPKKSDRRPAHVCL